MQKKYILQLAVILVLALALSGSALASVSFLGPAGTYTEEAAAAYFGSNETLMPVATVAESLALVKSGKSEWAVVPVENTIGGPVYNYLDAVVGDPAFTVVAEINLPIRQTLLGVKGAEVSGIKTVLSHPQGIAQSRDWLKANLPGVNVVEVSSTAEAARKVAEMGDPTVAAIAASRTASVYDLAILATDLQYTNTNVTRFWVVRAQKDQPFGKAKAALLMSGPADKLAALLYDFDRKGFKTVTLHDRPAKTKLGEYTFVLEVTGGPSDALVAALKNHPAFSVRVIGIYDTVWL